MLLPETVAPETKSPIVGAHSPEKLSESDEIDEAKESLRRYFEIGWQIATRLHREGKLDEVLTNAGLNPTVTVPPVDAASLDTPTTKD